MSPLRIVRLLFGRAGRRGPAWGPLLRATPDLILRVRRDGSFLDAAGNKSLLQFAAPATFVEAFGHTALVEICETGEVQVHECRLIVAGMPRVFELRAAANGSKEALLLVRETTEQKRSEEALRTAEAELRRVVGSVSDSIWSAEVDAEGRARFLYYSPPGERLTGPPPERYESMEKWLEAVHTDDRARVREKTQRLVWGESERESGEYRVVLEDGAIRWMQTTVVARRLANGRIRLDGVESDITAHKLADEAVRQANEELEAIIDASPLAIWATDLEGRVTRWNTAAERMFGWTRDEALNQKVPSIHEECPETARSENGAKCDGTASGQDIRCVRKDGATAELNLWSAPVRDGLGAVRGCIRVAADITGQRSLERQLQQSQRMEAVGRLAGGVAHDFNNLLTVITGYGYMLMEDAANEASVRTNMQEVLRAVERASALTNQLLAFSRRQVAQPKAIEINELVLNMDRMLRRVIGEDIELVTALSPEAGTINGDPAQIEQVIMNLIVNSRDAMPAGGRIAIETANVVLDREYARVHVSAKPGEYVMLSVVDDGVGMDEDTKSHIFEPFFTTKEHGKGTGLGLSTVYGIVKQADGDISVKSAPGKGTRVDIYLPRIYAKAAAEPEPAETESAPGTETVLLVEDEDDVRRLVSEVLGQNGYTVLAAANPEDAVEICRAYPGGIDLLLTDLVLPQMSGLDLVDRISGIRPEVRVLYMSGYTEDGKPGWNLSELGDAFLRKPFTPAALTQKVREVLERQEQRGAGAGK